jgi:GWxTD domain-containing protein
VTQELQVAPSDTSAGYGRVLVVPFRVRPGVHALEARVEARRYLLPGSGTGRPDVAKVEGLVAVPEPQAGREISDVEFVWSMGDSSAPEIFRRGGAARLPNPEHLYGLYETTLRASFSAHGAGDPRPWRWLARVLDADGAVVVERDTAESAAAWLDGDLALDLSTVPAGGYVLEIKAWQEGDPGALLRRARFSVGWDPATWRRDPEDVADEAHLILERSEEESFAQMQPGEQERRLAEYWRERDPTPDTAENEAQDTFRRRVAFANVTYGRAGIGRGMFSDMGRVYIRYGEPNEVHRQVMPGRDYELVRIINRLLTTDDRPVGDIQTQPGADMRPFEVWVYEGEIVMPFDAGERGGTARKLSKPLIFVFVDEQWLGDYRLRYSTE